MAPAQQAPNPILPSTTEILWGIVSFVVLVVLHVEVRLPVGAEVDAGPHRQDPQQPGRGREGPSGSQIILDEYQRQLADARDEANRIIEEARQAADQLRQDMVRRADEEVAELRRRSIEDLKAAQDRVMGQLRLQVRDLAIELAEKVVGRQLGPGTQPGPGRPDDRGVGSPPRREAA